MKLKTLTCKVTATFAAMAAGILLSHCGSSPGSARGTFQGQQFEFSVQDVQCVAGYSSGPAISGYDGVMNSPLVCTVSFSNNGYFSDFVSFTVSDVLPVYQQLGTWQVVDGGLISGTVRIQAMPQEIYTGVILFSEISNVAGHPVCAQYQLETGMGRLEGQFCGSVSVGF